MTQAKTFILIGHPVSHSISPAIHGAAYAACGLPHAYLAVDCPDEAAVAEQLGRVRSGEVAGANVTVPHKRLALALADRADASAARTRAANVLMSSGQGEVVAYNTDAIALCDEIALAQGSDTAVIIGSGGAALAAVVACQLSGIANIFVTARKFAMNVPQAEWAGARDLLELDAKLLAWPQSDSDAALAFREIARRASLFVQATSAGMKGADDGQALCLIVPWAEIQKDTLFYDVVYNPVRTPFIEAARLHGFPAKNGLGMLVGQAAHAFSLWLARPAPLEAMRVAAEHAVFGRVADGAERG